MRRLAQLCIFKLSFLPLAAFAGQTPSAAPKPAAAPKPRTTTHMTDPALLHPATLTAKAPDTYDVKLATTKGDVVIHVTRSWAPIGADRFYNLVKHGFFNDATPERYNRAAAEQAWSRTIEWFNQYVRSA